jgi:hypothetical protein
MKKTLLGISLALALVFLLLAQDKEYDRVENAGKVIKAILNAPDSIPQSVLDKADCVVILSDNRVCQDLKVVPLLEKVKKQGQADLMRAWEAPRR